MSRDRCYFIDVNGVRTRVQGDASRRTPESDQSLADIVSAAQRRLARERTDPTTSTTLPTPGGTP